MSSLVAVTAAHPLTYDGRSLVAGEVFAVDPVEATILHRQGAVFLRGTLVVSAPVPRVKRRYRRRDLTAEPA